MGYDITTARNGKEALDLTARIHPDLILLDLRIPVMDGIEVLQHMRADKALADVRAIGISAAVDDKEEMAIFTAACDDFIEKPIHIETLLQKIEQNLATGHF